MREADQFFGQPLVFSLSRHKSLLRLLSIYVSMPKHILLPFFDTFPTDTFSLDPFLPQTSENTVPVLAPFPHCIILLSLCNSGFLSPRDPESYISRAVPAAPLRNRLTSFDPTASGSPSYSAEGGVCSEEDCRAPCRYFCLLLLCNNT